MVTEMTNAWMWLWEWVFGGEEVKKLWSQGFRWVIHVEFEVTERDDE